MFIDIVTLEVSTVYDLINEIKGRGGGGGGGGGGGVRIGVILVKLKAFIFSLETRAYGPRIEVFF